jgi:hypothetical protein
VIGGDLVAKGQRIPVFVVRKHLWWYNDEWDEIVSRDPILTFRDRDKAEKHRQELERQARREGEGTQYNPFNMAGFGPEDQTSLTHEQLVVAVEALGLEPPDGHWWHDWWYNNHPSFTPEQREALWALFDRLSFYEVVKDFVEVRS